MRTFFALMIVMAIGMAHAQQGQFGFDAQTLARICGNAGMAPDFATGNCVSPRGRQINPRNTVQNPLSMPQPQPNDAIARCGAMGRGVDFVTGRCI